MSSFNWFIFFRSEANSIYIINPRLKTSGPGGAPPVTNNNRSVWCFYEMGTPDAFLRQHFLRPLVSVTFMRAIRIWTRKATRWNQYCHNVRWEGIISYRSQSYAPWAVQLRMSMIKYFLYYKIPCYYKGFHQQMSFKKGRMCALRSSPGAGYK